MTFNAKEAEERAHAMARDADRLDRGEIRPLSSLSMRTASEDLLAALDIARTREKWAPANQDCQGPAEELADLIRSVREEEAAEWEVTVRGEIARLPQEEKYRTEIGQARWDTLHEILRRMGREP